MEGVVEGQRRGGGGGALKGTSKFKERGRKEGGGRRGEEEGGEVVGILVGDHSSSAGHQCALLLWSPAKISAAKFHYL
jgi:hypothetical protein